MVDMSGREEIVGRLSRQLQQLQVANEKLVIFGVEQKELCERMQKHLAEARSEAARLRRVVNSIVEEMWGCDREEVVSPLNLGASRLLRLATRENEALPLREWLSRLEVRGEDGVPLTPEETPLLRALHGETVQEFRELVQLPSRGKLLVREVNSAPVRDEEGEIVGAVAVVRNIA